MRVTVHPDRITQTLARGADRALEDQDPVIKEMRGDFSGMLKDASQAIGSLEQGLKREEQTREADLKHPGVLRPYIDPFPDRIPFLC